MSNQNIVIVSVEKNDLGNQVCYVDPALNKDTDPSTWDKAVSYWHDLQEYAATHDLGSEKLNLFTGYFARKVDERADNLAAELAAQHPELSREQIEHITYADALTKFGYGEFVHGIYGEEPTDISSVNAMFSGIIDVIKEPLSEAAADQIRSAYVSHELAEIAREKEQLAAPDLQHQFVINPDGLAEAHFNQDRLISKAEWASGIEAHTEAERPAEVSSGKHFIVNPDGAAEAHFNRDHVISKAEWASGIEVHTDRKDENVSGVLRRTLDYILFEPPPEDASIKTTPADSMQTDPLTHVLEQSQQAIDLMMQTPIAGPLTGDLHMPILDDSNLSAPQIQEPPSVALPDASSSGTPSPDILIDSIFRDPGVTVDPAEVPLVEGRDFIEPRFSVADVLSGSTSPEVVSQEIPPQEPVIDVAINTIEPVVMQPTDPIWQLPEPEPVIEKTPVQDANVFVTSTPQTEMLGSWVETKFPPQIESPTAAEPAALPTSMPEPIFTPAPETNIFVAPTTDVPTTSITVDSQASQPPQDLWQQIGLPAPQTQDPVSPDPNALYIPPPVSDSDTRSWIDRFSPQSQQQDSGAGSWVERFFNPPQAEPQQVPVVDSAPPPHAPEPTYTPPAAAPVPESSGHDTWVATVSDSGASSSPSPGDSSGGVSV